MPSIFNASFSKIIDLDPSVCLNASNIAFIPGALGLLTHRIISVEK